MERHIKTKVSKYSMDFKHDIKSWIERNNLTIGDKNGENHTNEFLQFIYDYNQVEFNQLDFKRRSRVKTTIPAYDRCCGLCLNGERCTRKKLNESEYCGTHVKGIPYGKIKDTPTEVKAKTEIWIEDICGIHRFIDKNGNVYDSSDVLDSTERTIPRVVSRWIKNDKGEYMIV
jgi:hypothetical protein